MIKEFKNKLEDLNKILSHRSKINENRDLNFKNEEHVKDELNKLKTEKYEK